MNLIEFKENYWWPLASSKLRECTLAGYDSIWRNHIEKELGHLELDQISPRIIDSWIENQKTAGIARRSFAILRIILKTAYKMEFIEKVPTDKVLKLPPKQYPKQPTLTMDEVNQLIDGFHGNELDAWVILMVTLGLRREEGCALLWSDIDLETGKVEITKGAQIVNGIEVINPPKTLKGYRSVYISDEYLPRIRAIAKKSGRVTPYNPCQTAVKYKKHCLDSGLPYVPPKNLRTTFGTLAVQQGWDVGRIASWMGHYDPSVTLSNYVHPREDDIYDLTDLWNKQQVDRCDDLDESIFDKIVDRKIVKGAIMSFKQAVKNVMKGGKYGKDAAAAIVANASRNASPAAKKKNPKLKKVK